MPAFGPTQGEGELWGLAYFTKQLPRITPKQYDEMTMDPAKAAEMLGGPGGKTRSEAPGQEHPR